MHNVKQYFMRFMLTVKHLLDSQLPRLARPDEIGLGGTSGSDVPVLVAAKGAQPWSGCFPFCLLKEG